MLCKTIILSNSQNLTSNAPKGILTLSKDNNHIIGKIRLYNIANIPPTCKIGLYINQKVYTAPIYKKPHHYEFELQEDIDITESVYCAIIDNTSHDKNVVLEGGSFNGFYFTDSPFDAVLEAKDDQLEQTIDKAITQSQACEQCDCNDCEYKKYFYDNYCNTSPTTINNTDNISTLEQIDTTKQVEQADNNQSSTKSSAVDKFQDNVIASLEQQTIESVEALEQNLYNTIKTNPQPDNTQLNSATNTEQANFLNDIIYQLDEILSNNPADDMLNSIIPNSKFVRVENEAPYVLGVIYENKLLKYIAYGVPAEYNTLPPADLGQHYQWLPLNPHDVMSDGYFMIYQDALTGNIVEINFEE